MSRYVIENVSFYTSNLSEEMQLIKIKGAFSCDDNRAREILEDIINSKSIIVEKDIYRDLVGFGISCRFTSEETYKKLEEEKQKAKQEHQEYLEKIKRANAWFETLSEEERENVKILGHTKFFVSPVG